MPATLLLTRPLPASRRFLDQVQAVTGPVKAVISPLLVIESIDAILPDMSFSGLILTSENGAEAAGRLGLPHGLRAWTVGDRTAQVAQALGYPPISADGDADALVALILASGEAGPLLHLRGEHVRGDVAGRLSAGGVPTSEMVVYRQSAAGLSADARRLVSGAAPVVAPVFSPRTVSILMESGNFLAPLHVVAISAAVAQAARAADCASLTVATAPDGAAMVAATVATLRGLARA